MAGGRAGHLVGWRLSLQLVSQASETEATVCATSPSTTDTGSRVRNDADEQSFTRMRGPDFS